MIMPAPDEEAYTGNAARHPVRLTAEMVRTARQASGLDTTAFAARCGVTPSVLAQFESGTKAPGLSVLQGILAPDHADLPVLVAVAEGKPSAETNAGDRMFTDEELELRRLVIGHIRSQGFDVRGSTILAPVHEDKARLRELHDAAVLEQRYKACKALQPRESQFVARLVRGDQLDPSRIRPALVPVTGHAGVEALLWRWCTLHWSIPVSRGYGRRLRFLVVDQAHGNAVMGLIGLADPVFALRGRDEWIGWDKDQRSAGLVHVMEAFALGAVPPYAQLCGGKLAALLATSTEVRDEFRHKYGHRQTLIGGQDRDAQLVLVTTHSALGRSSMYNRLRRPTGRPAYESVGFTVGSGDFHIVGSVYERLASYARRTMDGEFGRHERWTGQGFRNKREVLHKALSGLGLDARGLRHHGVRRQAFVAPLATNTAAWLRGADLDLDWCGESVDDLADWWSQRWAIPRSRRVAEWRSFEPHTWRLYGD